MVQDGDGGQGIAYIVIPKEVDLKALEELFSIVNIKAAAVPVLFNISRIPIAFGVRSEGFFDA